jgi:hypothetical protein
MVNHYCSLCACPCLEPAPQVSPPRYPEDWLKRWRVLQVGTGFVDPSILTDPHSKSKRIVTIHEYCLGVAAVTGHHAVSIDDDGRSERSAWMFLLAYSLPKRTGVPGEDVPWTGTVVGMTRWRESGGVEGGHLLPVRHILIYRLIADRFETGRSGFANGCGSTHVAADSDRGQKPTTSDMYTPLPPNRDHHLHRLAPLEIVPCGLCLPRPHMLDPPLHPSSPLSPVSPDPHSSPGIPARTLGSMPNSPSTTEPERYLLAGAGASVHPAHRGGSSRRVDGVEREGDIGLVESWRGVEVKEEGLVEYRQGLCGG